jgi:hypothetical protein
MRKRSLGQKWTQPLEYSVFLVSVSVVQHFMENVNQESNALQFNLCVSMKFLLLMGVRKREKFIFEENFTSTSSSCMS